MPPDVLDKGDFGSDEQDVRIQISSDGICPFKLHKSTWSTWLVLASFLYHAYSLNSREIAVPFEHFDVWIRPLIDELKELWKGVPENDVSKPKGQRGFKLRAAVLYTTHDFPGYGTVSGSAHQGYAACPPCGDQLRGTCAYESRKITYRDARRWLRPDHELRSSQYDKLFNGLPETRLPSTAKTPAQQLAVFQEYQDYLAGRRNNSTGHHENRAHGCDGNDAASNMATPESSRASTRSRSAATRTAGGTTSINTRASPNRSRMSSFVSARGDNNQSANRSEKPQDP